MSVVRIEDIHEFSFPNEITYLPKRTDSSGDSGLIPLTTEAFGGLGVNHSHIYYKLASEVIPTGTSGIVTFPLTNASLDYNLYGGTKVNSQEIYSSTFILYVKIIFREFVSPYNESVNYLVGMARGILNFIGNGVNTHKSVILGDFISNNDKTFNFYDNGTAEIINISDQVLTPTGTNQVLTQGITAQLNITNPIPSQIVAQSHTLIKFNI